MVDHEDRRHWRGPIYVNAEDASIWVRKRSGLGWTLNFGQPVSWLVLIAVVAVPIALALAITYAVR